MRDEHEHFPLAVGETAEQVLPRDEAERVEPAYYAASNGWVVAALGWSGSRPCCRPRRPGRR